MKILVTGAAGFIGSQLSAQLIARDDEVIGVDNLNDYYSVDLKQARLRQFDNAPLFKFYKLDIADHAAIAELFGAHNFDVVVNLAAQAGVRHSIENPQSYISSNLVGFHNILEACRQRQIENFVFASSSSVYGANTQQPFSEADHTDHPLALYAATKKSIELIAHSYAHLFKLPCTGLRFFTVYGPWGRPDMALFKFTKNILENKPIEVYNHGQMIRDFTYVDDIITGVMRVIDNPAEPNPNWFGAQPDPGTSNAPYAIYNIGNSHPVELESYITAIETATGKKAEKIYLPMQPGDVMKTFANTDRLQEKFNYKPSMPIETGVGRFVEWYRGYYKA